MIKDYFVFECGVLVIFEPRSDVSDGYWLVDADQLPQFGIKRLPYPFPPVLSSLELM